MVHWHKCSLQSVIWYEVLILFFIPLILHQCWSHHTFTQTCAHTHREKKKITLFFPPHYDSKESAELGESRQQLPEPGCLHRRTGLLDGDNTVFSELASPHQSLGCSVTEYLVFGRNEREGENANRACLIGSGKMKVLECGRKIKVVGIHPEALQYINLWVVMQAGGRVVHGYIQTVWNATIFCLKIDENIAWLPISFSS